MRLAITILALLVAVPAFAGASDKPSASVEQKLSLKRAGVRYSFKLRAQAVIRYSVEVEGPLLRHQRRGLSRDALYRHRNSGLVGAGLRVRVRF